jgi:cyclopropane-fatty-acyl-phospholipid synthase
MPTPASELGSRNYRPGPVLPATPAWRAVFRDGTVRQTGEGPPAFTFRLSSESALERVLATDAYAAAMAFVRGEFDVEGDLAAAIRFKGWQPQSNLRNRLLTVVARSATALESVFQSKAQTAHHIRFHYDRSNDFYRLFLDPRMVYSCAYFRAPEIPLEEAQLAKLDHICRKLDVRPGERFLDIGCGWGALLAHAAGRYGATATGCTLSQAQYEFASARLEGRARVLELDYRDLTGRYDKIASVGMFEHVGLRRASQYFRKMAALLTPDGLFLNHAIARPQGVEDDAGSLFVRRRIFPGAQLIHLSETIREAESAGFEVLDIENLRPHYARTCRLWQERLTANREAALRVADKPTFRAWRLWLAACSLSFEEGVSSVYQVLMAKRGSARRTFTREYMYGRAGE